MVRLPMPPRATRCVITASQVRAWGLGLGSGLGLGLGSGSLDDGLDGKQQLIAVLFCAEDLDGGVARIGHGADRRTGNLDWYVEVLWYFMVLHSMLAGYVLSIIVRANLGLLTFGQAAAGPSRPRSATPHTPAVALLP